MKQSKLERAAGIPAVKLGSEGPPKPSDQVIVLRDEAIALASDQARAMEIWSHQIDLIGLPGAALPSFLRTMLVEELITVEQFYPLRDRAASLGGW